MHRIAMLENRDMPNSSPRSADRGPWLKTLIWGLTAGILAGVAMLFTMALLRLVLGWPTPTELIFDRLFPLLTVEFFIGSLVRAGGYTPLKLQGVFGALAGQVIVAGLGGVIYAFYLRRRDRRDVGQTTSPSLIDRRGFDYSRCFSCDYPVCRFALADALHQLPRLSARHRTRNRLSRDAHFILAMRDWDHVFLRPAKQTAACCCCR